MCQRQIGIMAGLPALSSLAFPLGDTARGSNFQGQTSLSLLNQFGGDAEDTFHCPVKKMWNNQSML